MQSAVERPCEPTTSNESSVFDLQSAIKRVVDIALAALACLLLAPLLLGVALLVKLSSPGPVIHRRRVMGLGGEQFDAFKFRTMVVNGQEVLASHPELQRQLEREQKLKDDPRVTYHGRWLRRFSIDELPQLVNVLRGEMSLVGPRMISPPELARYGDRGCELLTVRPGITGLWQVSGRSDRPAEDRVRLDLDYIEQRSIGLDLSLLVLTVSVVFKGRGAY
jgi:lipopolysaccharide/colanic/teichoic acid biosynthesis glycosyltransferase